MSDNVSNRPLCRHGTGADFIQLTEILSVLITQEHNMAHKTELIGTCPKHGEFYMDAEDSPCPSCEDAEEAE
jgi:hypothetical protein